MGETKITHRGESEPDARLAAVESHNVMLTGAPMTGKCSFALDVVGEASRAGRDALLVTTTRSAPQLLDERSATDMGHVIDCTPIDVDEHEWVTSLASPADLTGVTMPLSEFLTEATNPVLVFDSVSTLLMYVEPTVAFRFLSVVTAHVRRSNGLGVFTLDEGTHEPKTVNTFAHLFDGRLAVRSESGVREVKSDGVGAVASEWTPI